MQASQECYAVIFTATKSDQSEGYEETAMRMVQLAMKQQGFLGIEYAQNEQDEITVSYWESEAAIQNWRNHPEHLLAQQKGKEQWYSRYKIRVVKVLREYGFKAEKRAP